MESALGLGGRTALTVNSIMKTVEKCAQTYGSFSSGDIVPLEFTQSHILSTRTPIYTLSTVVVSIFFSIIPYVIPIRYPLFYLLKGDDKITKAAFLGRGLVWGSQGSSISWRKSHVLCGLDKYLSSASCQEEVAASQRKEPQGMAVKLFSLLPWFAVKGCIGSV